MNTPVGDECWLHPMDCLDDMGLSENRGYPPNGILDQKFHDSSVELD